MKKYNLFIIFLSILINLYLIKVHDDAVENSFIFWASCIYWSNIIPLIYYVNYAYRKDVFPFMGLVGLFVILSYSLPVFFIPSEYYQVAPLNIESLKLAFWGYLIFHLSYIYFDTRKLPNVIFDPFKNITNYQKIRYVSIFFLFITYLGDFMSIPGLVHLSSISIYIYLGITLTLINKKINISIIEKILFCLVLLSELIIRLLGGLLAPLALLTVFLMIIDYNIKFSIKRAVIILIPFLISFILFSPLKGEYRKKIWYTEKEGGYTYLEQMQTLIQLYSEYEVENNKNYTNDIQKYQSSFFWRYSYQASALSLAINKTPSEIPYWMGESYLLFSKFIPRLFWPDKPEENMGYKFGTRYQIIDLSNTSTSMNTPILTEMFINFAIPGVIIGMIILAYLYSYINNYFNNRKISEFGKIFSVSIIFPLIVHESNFTLVFGNIPLMVLSFYIIGSFYFK